VRRRLYTAVTGPVARTIVAVLVFALSTAGLVLTSYADQYVNGGVSWGPTAPRIDNAEVNPLGINVFLEKEVDPAKVERTLQMVQDGGFKWIRQTFAWNDIEISGKGDYVDKRGPQWVDAWEKYDRIVEGAARHGLQIIARLDSPPVWARVPGDDVQTYPKGPPANYNDYGDFVKAVAARYKGKIKYFQIWNEPNLQGEWGGHPISAQEYTQLLKVAHDAVKSVDPNAVILTAALAPTAEYTFANQNDVLYLEDMYLQGAGQYFDILSTMLYGLGQSPEERRTDLKRLNFSRPILLRRVMEKNGDAHKPIWISEYAWISLPPDFNGDPSKNIWGKSVDEETQAKWLVEGYERAAAEWPWMGVMSVWHFRQPDPIPGEPANYFAIVRDDFTPRPAYTRIQEYSKQIPASWHMPRQKPLWNALGFPLAYGLLGLLALVSGAYGLSRLGAWAGAALDRPRERYSEAARERARNGAVVVGMALLVGLYYRSESLPAILLSLAGWGLLAFLKPSMGLAAVAFVIPFFWYPKEVRGQHFPLAETLLMLTFGGFMARKAVAALLPGVAARLRFSRDEQEWGRSHVSFDTAKLNGDNVEELPDPVLITRPLPQELTTQQPDVDDLVPARWPTRPLTGPLPDIETRFTKVLEANRTQAVPVTEDATHATDAGPDSTTVSLPYEAATLTPAQNGQTKAPTISRFPTRDSVPTSRITARFKNWSREDAFAPQAVALLLVGTFSLFTLADPAFARDSLRAYRWVIVEPVLFYFLLTDVIITRRALWRVADFFVAAAVAVAFVGLGQFVLGNDTLTVEGVSRVMGVYQHPNNLALYLGRALPFAACAGLFLPWGPRKALYLAAAIPLAITTLLTYSRGAYLAVALAIAVAVAVGLIWRPGVARTREWRNRLVLSASLASITLGLLLIVTAAVLLPRLPPRLITLGSGVLRVGLWESSLAMLRDHPIFGVGPDQFLNQFQANYMTKAQQAEGYTAHPHNLLLDYWLTLGIIGVPILLWLLWRYFREALIIAKSVAMGRDPGPPVGSRQALDRRAIALGLLASMLDFLLHGLVDNSYFLMDLAMVFWMSCGLLQLTRLKIED
jgi:O-antigen ligase